MIQFKIVVILLIFTINASAKLSVSRISPSNWWTGMESSSIILLVEGSELTGAGIQFSTPFLKLMQIIPSQNPNYLLAEVQINSRIIPGNYQVQFFQDGKERDSYNFEIKQKSAYKRKSIVDSDIIYQIIPDRFRDGNYSNNNPKGYYERQDKNNPAGIHGGDLAGIIESANYINNLGFTALSLTPIFESNQFVNSYNHIGITDFYNIDERIGSINELQNLVSLFHSKSIKISLSFLFNQLGKQNILVKNNPFPSWIVPDFKSYSDQLIDPIYSDPYINKQELNLKLHTWPDMGIAVFNQEDEYLRRYLIQNCIWWIETTRVDAIKIEKVFLNSQQFLNELTDALNKDFSGLNIITDYEAAPPYQVEYFQKFLRRSNLNLKADNNYLASGMANSFSSYIDFNQGLFNIYHSLALDYVYDNPSNNIIFIDNYNLSRAYSNADKDIDQLKMMLALLFSLKGTPQITYGTEALLDGIATEGTGFVRKSMPGLSANDIPNIFLNKGLSTQQHELLKYLSKLIELRKVNIALIKGELIHYLPEDGLYVLFRKYNANVVMVIINNHPNQEKRLDLEKFESELKGYTKATNLITNQSYTDLSSILISSKSVMIMELQ